MGGLELMSAGPRQSPLPVSSGSLGKRSWSYTASMPSEQSCAENHSNEARLGEARGAAPWLVCISRTF
eukprot:scaffold241710_cov42-Prasinocladus_malaysianus.AAC.1